MMTAISHSIQTFHPKNREMSMNATPAPRAISAKPRAAFFHTPQERPINADRIKIVNHTRPICSRGYSPIMKSVRFASMTPQRASVVAHSIAGLRRMYSSQAANNVRAMLYQVLNRFFRSQARGPIVRTGGFTTTAAMSALHQLNSVVVDVHQQGCEQADAQVAQHHDRNDFDGCTGLIKDCPRDTEEIRKTDGNGQGRILRQIQILTRNRWNHDTQCLRKDHQSQRLAGRQSQRPRCLHLPARNCLNAGAHDLRDEGPGVYNQSK